MWRREGLSEIRPAYFYIPPTATAFGRDIIEPSISPTVRWHVEGEDHPIYRTDCWKNTMNKAVDEKLIAYVNRKNWWHVPPVDPMLTEAR